jgi:hypothetical protein
MGGQCTQGYPYRFVMKIMGKNKDESINPKTWHFVISKEILHTYQEVQGGMETRSIDIYAI